MNSLAIIGRLVADPTSGVADSGTAWCRLRLAVARPRRGADDIFITAVTFGALAESCGQWLRQGRIVGVTGWLDQDQDRGSEHHVVANSVDFLDPKPADVDEPEP